MTETKKEVHALLDNLPDNCTLEDVQYQLYVVQKVKNGLEAVDRGEGVEHDQAIRRLGKWLSK
jgi:predicted transcriptional regulator